MKRSLYLILLISTFMCYQPAQAQKQTPRQKSGKNLRGVMLSLYQNKNIPKEKNLPCHGDKLMRSIKKKDLAPSEEQATKIVNQIVDSLRFKWSTSKDPLDAFDKAKSMTDYAFQITGKNYGDLDVSMRNDFKEHYFRLKRLRNEGYDIFKNTFKFNDCDITVSTNIKANSWKEFSKKTKDRIIEWELRTKVVLNCDCNKKTWHRVKSTVYEFSAKTKGPLQFNIMGTGYLENRLIERFGLRFQKLTNPSGARTQLVCCSKENSEDGSFTDPEEPINYNSPFVNTGIGIGFVNDADTQIVGNAGVLFPVASIGENPLFLGGQIGVQSSSISSDFPVNEYRIGPILEYDHQLNENGLEWVSGIHSGYLFGSEDFGGADQDFNGFFANLYTGLDIPLGENLSLVLLTSFLEYQSVSFDFGEETVTDSFGPSFDRINLTAGLRFNFGNQP